MVSKEIFPPTPYRTATVRGRKISFVDPVDVIRELFGRLKDLSDMKFEHEPHGGDIDHPCRAKRFRQCHRYAFASSCFGLCASFPIIGYPYLALRYMRARARKHRIDHRDCRLILPVFYIDGHVQNPSRSASVTGIYMTLANAGKKEMHSAESRILLCELPKGVDEIEAIRVVIVRPMRLLERGFDVYFRADSRMRRCYGSAYSILGDHPEMARLAGTYMLTVAPYNGGLTIPPPQTRSVLRADEFGLGGMPVLP